jgi:hypothetical protein
MWWRKPSVEPDSHDAQHDLALTENIISRLELQTAEVDALVENLNARRIRNNFGDSLTLAMERRTS